MLTRLPFRSSKLVMPESAARHDGEGFGVDREDGAQILVGPLSSNLLVPL